MKGAKKYKCTFYFITKKYARIIELFAKDKQITLEVALASLKEFYDKDGIGMADISFKTIRG